MGPTRKIIKDCHEKDFMIRNYRKATLTPIQEKLKMTIF